MSRRTGPRLIFTSLLALLLVSPLAFMLDRTGAQQTPTSAVSGANLYFYRDGKIGVAHRDPDQLPVGQSIYDAALTELFKGPADDELSSGLSSVLPDDASLASATVVDSDGVATVNLGTEFATMGENQPVTGRVLGLRMAQITYTLTQFSNVTGVQFQIAGTPNLAYDSDGAAVNRPVTRNDYESVTPAILVETPGVWDRFESPLHLTGTANTFEATVQYRLSDARNEIVTEGHFSATSGTGTRGTFDETIPFEVTRQGRATLLLFELSAADGSMINVVAIPVEIVRPATPTPTATTAVVVPPSRTPTPAPTKTATPAPTKTATPAPTVAGRETGPGPAKGRRNEPRHPASTW